MFDYYFIIYGVFNGNRCLMVGSTNNLHRRILGYKKYKWFSCKKHVHKILWEGTITVCDKEQAHFIRAAKEIMWIIKMKTWWSQGGKNQASPIAQVLGGPYAFEDRSQIMCAKGNAATSLWTKTHPKESFERGRKGGLMGGKKGGQLGGKRVRELYPGMAEENGRKQGLINAQTGWMREVAVYGRHIRYHKKKNVKLENCYFCMENIELRKSLRGG